MIMIIIVFDEAKWNASLILACDSGELVALCKNPHSCKDAKMATPLNFCRGVSRHSY